MPPPARALGSRALLALSAAVLALLVAEGLAAVVAERPLLAPALHRWLERRAPDEPVAPRADPDAPGLYAAHPDPLVGYTLRRNAELDILDGHIRSDALGLRCRRGPPATEDALSIAVIGDSVAFGFGLDDELALAVRLEQLLRPRGPVVCRTVALPGWNQRNAVHFLLDHWDALEPDIVIAMPIGNDLMNTDGVTEAGLRRAAPDIAEHDPWLPIFQGLGLGWLKPALPKVVAGDAAALNALLGTAALDGDLTPESRRRHDANAATLAMLAQHLRRTGARLLIAPYIEDAYGWRLQQRLLVLAPDLPVVPLLAGVPPEFMLPDNPHPNAETVDALAHWLAEELVARGWVPGDGPPIPAVAERYAALRSVPATPQLVADVCAALDAQARAAVRSVLDWRTADGLAQVYGGMNADASAGARLALMVGRPAGAAVLEVVLAPVAGRPDLLPLAVRVEANGTPLGTVVIPREGEGHARFPVPARTEAGEPAGEPAPLELQLVPERWAVAPVRGVPTQVSFRPLRVACTAP